jgi:hypothetical protein
VLEVLRQPLENSITEIQPPARHESCRVGRTGSARKGSD